MLALQPLYPCRLSLELYFTMTRLLTGSLCQRILSILPQITSHPRLFWKAPLSKPGHEAEDTPIVIQFLAEYSHLLRKLTGVFPKESVTELESEKTCSICPRHYNEIHDDPFPLACVDWEDVAPRFSHFQNGHTRLGARGLQSAARLWRVLPFASDRRDLERKRNPIHESPTLSPFPPSNHSWASNFENFQSAYSVSTDSSLSQSSGTPESADLNKTTGQDSATKFPYGNFFEQDCLRRWFAPRSKTRRWRNDVIRFVGAWVLFWIWDTIDEVNQHS